MTTYDPAYQKRWALDRNRGITRTVPAGPTRDHIEGLLEAGASVRAVAECAGLNATVVSQVHRGQRTVRRATATAILAVTMDDVRARHRAAGFVPKVGSVRRIQALLALGWPHAGITAAMHARGTGTRTQSHLVMHQAGDWVTRATADAVTAVYGQLSMRPGPSQTTRDRARRRGYVPPLAWEDADLDDPTASPAVDTRDPADRDDQASVDEVAVLRRCNGDHHITLTLAERHAATRRLHATGLSDHAIAARLGYTDRTILRYRGQLGLPANPSPYTTRRPRPGRVA